MAELTGHDDERARVRKLGLMVLGAFGALFVLAFCGGGAWVGYAGYHSESAGVRAMYMAALPLGFSFFGLLGAAAAHFFVKEKAIFKVVIPVVAGGVGGPLVLGLIFVFFEFIFPAL
ncbi:MAG: hypothetical protein KC502_16325 [Myxococcales bacterium]|nr:hypothetical protein [Myxococcales bacterium]